MCEALCQYCTSLGLEVLGSSTDGKQSLHFIQNEMPDFAIIEASLSGFNGIEIVEQLRRYSNNHTHIILYLNAKDPLRVRKALSLRLSSILFTDDGIDQLTKILLNRKPVPAAYQNKRSSGSLSEIRPGTTQLKILSMVGTHKTMPEIAEELFISPHTVNNHVANIRRKLDLQGRGVVLKYALAIKHRLVEVDGKVSIANYLNSYAVV